MDFGLELVICAPFWVSKGEHGQSVLCDSGSDCVCGCRGITGLAAPSELHMCV